MTPHRHRAARWTAALSASTLALTLLGSVVPASARPVLTPRGTANPDFALATGTPIQLGPDATLVRVLQSPYGGTVAALWTVPTPAGQQVWARLKDGSMWGSNVMVSQAGTSAHRPDADIDSDGTLMVAWAEGAGTGERIVSRRVSGSTAGPRIVQERAVSDGPYVGAGPQQDVLVWTARDGLTEQPFASVDAGAGFGQPQRVSSRAWRYDVLPGSLAVNSDGPQVHVLYLSRDTDADQVQSSWSLLDPARSAAWQPTDDLRQRQSLTPAPHRPSLAVTHDARGTARAVLVFTNQDGDVRYPTAQVFTPGTGTPEAQLSDPTSLENPDRGDGAPFRGVLNRQGLVVAAHGGSPGLATVLLRPSDTTISQQNFSAVNTPCAGYDDWFMAWPLDVPELHCVVPDQGSTPEIYSASTGPTLRLDVDATLGGSLTVSVPTPLLPVHVVTERSSAGGNAVWLVDHTEGGDDRDHPQLPFRRLAPPTVTGTLMVGHTVRATSGSWLPAPVEVSYRWLVDGVVLPGATGATLTLTKAMQGRRISVHAFPERSGYDSAHATSAASARVAAWRPAPIKRFAKPKVKGTVRVGKVLTVSKGRWSPSPTKVAYRWKVNGKSVKGGTRPSLRLTKKMAGKRVQVTVTVSRPQHATTKYTVKVKKKVAPAKKSR